VEQVLAWADAYHARAGGWPSAASGAVADAPGENWRAIDAALRNGGRGLAAGASLSDLLRERRGKDGVRPLAVDQILGWADAHRTRTGEWPKARSSPVVDAPGETWSAIDYALRRGYRGLPGDSSLSWLLAQHGREG
jgi:hypothetical protein